MLGMLKRRWKPRRTAARRSVVRSDEAEQCDEAPPPSTRANLRVAGGRIEFAPPPAELTDAGTQTDTAAHALLSAQLEAQAAQLAKLQRQVARGREERELRVRAEAARAQADHTKLAALGRALRKEKLRREAQAQQAAASATTAEARWLQAQASSRRLAQENLSLRAQLEHCCAASEALCGGLARARRENAGLRAAAARSERCLEDVARTVLQALVAQAHLRQRIAQLDKQPEVLSRQDSLTWDCVDSSAGDGDACADSPSAAELRAACGDDGYSTMSPDLPRVLAAGTSALPALYEEPARLRHSFPPAGRVPITRARPLSARSLPSTAAVSASRWPGPGWATLSDWSMSSEERLSGSGSSDWSCQPGVDFTRDFYRLVRFGSQRSLASRGGAGGGAWGTQPTGSEDAMAVFCSDSALGRDARELRLSLEADTFGELYLGKDSLYHDANGAYHDSDRCYLNEDGSFRESIHYLNEDGPYLKDEDTYFCEEGLPSKEDSCQLGNRLFIKDEESYHPEDTLQIKNDLFNKNDGYLKEDKGHDLKIGTDILRADDDNLESEKLRFVEEIVTVGHVQISHGDLPAKECRNEEDYMLSKSAQDMMHEEKEEQPEKVNQPCQTSQASQREGSSDSDAADGSPGASVDAYQRLHRLHKVRRHRKADAARGQRLRAAPARASILERAVFTRFGPAEQAAVARFDFLCSHEDSPPPSIEDAHTATSSSTSSRSSGSSGQWEYVALDDHAHIDTLDGHSDQWQLVSAPSSQWNQDARSTSQWDHEACSTSQWKEPGSSKSQWARVESSEESSEEVTQQLSLSDSC